MNLRNFRIDRDCMGLEVNGHYLDLHNNFSFLGFKYEVACKSITLEWVRRNEEWVHPKDPEMIQLVFMNAELFKLKERDSNESASEDDCLSTIGFVHRSLLDDLECYSKCEPDEETNHLNICFNSGQAMKVAAHSAELKIR